MNAKTSSRNTKTRLKTAKGRRISSTLWLERQLNDPYVINSKKEGYRSRAAYKLIEINDKFNFLLKNQIVVDLGAAPGGWTQVAVKKNQGSGKVISIDLAAMEPIEGAVILQHDFLTDAAIFELNTHISGKVNVVLSDMASSSCGHPGTDHIRIMMLCEAAFDFACTVLAPNGTFVAKILQGGTENNLLHSLKKSFKIVKHYKPPASRADSAESYVIATGFKA